MSPDSMETSLMGGHGNFECAHGRAQRTRPSSFHFSIVIMVAIKQAIVHQFNCQQQQQQSTGQSSTDDAQQCSASRVHQAYSRECDWRDDERSSWYESVNYFERTTSSRVDAFHAFVANNTASMATNQTERSTEPSNDAQQ